MSAFEVKNLSVGYQTKSGLLSVLTNVSFSVERGCAIGLWGHSGCGKSTAIKSLLGLPANEPGWISGFASFDNICVSPDVTKYIRIDGDGAVYKDCIGFQRDHYKKIKRYLGIEWRAIFQEPIYSFEMEIPILGQSLAIFDDLARRGNYKTEELREEFSGILEQLNLPLSEFGSRGNLEFSGGECQRILLALALVGKPRLLFADEPTTAMDGKTREQVNALLKDKMCSPGMSMIIASHSCDELLDLVHTIFVLCSGTVVEIFNPQSLSKDNVEEFHPYTRRLWDSIGDQDGIAKDGGYGRSSSGGQGCPYVSYCPYSIEDNKLRDICNHESPPLFSINAGHQVACWLYWKSNGNTSNLSLED